MYELKQSECVSFQLTEQEYIECVNVVRQMRMSEFIRTLEKTVDACGINAVADKIKSLNIL